MKYELLYIIAQDTTDEQKEALINKFSKMIEDKGGKVLSLEKIGTKKFAFYFVPTDVGKADWVHNIDFPDFPP